MSQLVVVDVNEELAGAYPPRIVSLCSQLLRTLNHSLPEWEGTLVMTQSPHLRLPDCTPGSQQPFGLKHFFFLMSGSGRSLLLHEAAQELAC